MQSTPPSSTDVIVAQTSSAAPASSSQGGLALVRVRVQKRGFMNGGRRSGLVLVLNGMDKKGKVRQGVRTEFRVPEGEHSLQCKGTPEFLLVRAVVYACESSYVGESTRESEATALVAGLTRALALAGLLRCCSLVR
jgi:hypothetical protein